MFPTFIAQATFRGQSCDWTLEVRDGTLEFWDATRDNPDQRRYSVWHPIHARDAHRWTRAALEALWREAMEWGRVGRRIEMSDELTVFSREGEQGMMRFSGRHREVKAQTYVNYYGCYEREHDALKQELELRALKCYEGDFGTELHQAGIPFAFNPEGYLGPRNKRKLHIECVRGDEAELEEVNEWAWKLDPQWLEDTLNQSKVEGAGAKVIVRPDEAARVVFGGYDKNWGFGAVDHPRIALWEELLRYFEPTPDPIAHRGDIEAGARLFCLGLAPHPDWHHFNFDTNSVVQHSFHERLELRLPLANWLRERAKLFEQRIAELLF